MTHPQSLQANLRRIGMNQLLAVAVEGLLSGNLALDDWPFKAFPRMRKDLRREAQEWLERHVHHETYNEYPFVEDWLQYPDGSEAPAEGISLSAYAQALEQAREGSG